LADQALDTVAWLRVLDELELSVDDANSVAAGDPGADALDFGAAAGWQPPAEIGVIPIHLEERARDLLVLQLKLVHELGAALRSASRHLAAVRAIPTARGAKGSVYLDVTG